jgi:preprotein translocase subunit SecD
MSGPVSRFIRGCAAIFILVVQLLGGPSFADTPQLLRFETDLLTFDVSDDQLAKVEIVADYSGNPALMMTFSPAIWQKFANFTKTAVGRRMVISVCGSVVTDPIIQSEIENGVVMISGGNVNYVALQTALMLKECSTVPDA